MRKAWIVARREYRENVKSKTFLIAVALMPIFMFGSIAVQVFLQGRVETDTKRVGVLDQSGSMFAALAQAAAARNETEIFDEDGETQTQPRIDLVEITPEPGNDDQQRLDLSDQVRRGELFAFVEIPAMLLESGDDATPESVGYYSDRPTYRSVQRWISRILSSRVQLVRLEQAGLDPAVVQGALQPVPFDNLGLVSREESGAIRPAEEVNELLTFIVPFAVLMLVFMTLALAAQPLLNGVLEEKMQRIAEVLLGSMSPFELMLGKLIGSAMVALTLVGIYMVGGYMVANHYGYADLLSAKLIAWFVVFQSLAILMYGSMFLGIGAACNDVREAQSLVLPIWLPIIIPMFFAGTVIEHPNSVLSTSLSLFPIFSPLLMLLRLAVPTNVPVWQPIVAAFGNVLATLFCVWAGGRVFRVGLLLQGTPPSFRHLARWVLRG